MGKLEPNPELLSFQEDMDCDDEIEILEVVGLDENGVPLGEFDAGVADPQDDEDIVLDFDEIGEATTITEASPAAEVPARQEPSEADFADDVARNDRDRLVRLHADFDNYKKRVERDQGDFRRYSSSQLILRMLPVLDNFERAIAAAPDEGPEAPLRHGVILIFKQMLEELRTEGLICVDTVGQPFDPNIHEAVATDSNPELPSNIVIEEMQRGYVMHDRLLRPALVKVNLPVGGVDGTEPDGESGGNL